MEIGLNLILRTQESILESKSHLQRDSDQSFSILHARILTTTLSFIILHQLLSLLPHYNGFRQRRREHQQLQRLLCLGLLRR